MGVMKKTHETGGSRTMELKLQPLTRARMEELKIHDANVDNSMVSYMEEALKNKLEGFEDQGKASKLLPVCTLSKDYSREKIGCWRRATLLPTVALPLPSQVGF
ncbi:hypothetical protein M9H77_30249 [Catharanthus roseus]|uniref:Uncharacterized protein n=1 Tax=Catharanthus roseus TaxID=4058 RepID=A0ACB9ZY10_CATRO|nr:hypothetical protein M9H77_30249 [Catharanthus roseus]